MGKRLIPVLMGLMLLTPVVVSLEGCPAAGVAQAQTFKEKLAYGYATHTAVMQAATTGLQSGGLSSADGAKVLADADAAKAVLDGAAAAATAGDSAGADSKLAIAISALTSIQSFLNSKVKP